MSDPEPRWRKCRNCVFVNILERRGKATGWVECHKAHPGLSPDDGTSWWPTTETDDPRAWCGDWDWDRELYRHEAQVAATEHKRLEEAK